MRIELGPVAAKRLRKDVPERIVAAVNSTLDRLATNPYLPRPDHAGSWRKIWRGAPNHRHVDLPDGWRLCYTVMNDEEDVLFVLVLFIGTHREYDHRYGFKPSG